MRAIAASVFMLGYSCGLAAADDKDKLDEKFLVGNWTIKYVTGNNDDTIKKTIEFKDDGTYVWYISKRKEEGTYTLKGTTLELTKKGKTGTTFWKELSIKDGKIIHPIGKSAQNELTRDEKK